MNTPYAFTIDLDLPIDPAIETLRSALAAERMSIVSEGYVQATLKQKLRLDSHPQRLLGICSPQAAQAMLSAMASDNTAVRTACELASAALRRLMTRLKETT